MLHHQDCNAPCFSQAVSTRASSCAGSTSVAMSSPSCPSISCRRNVSAHVLTPSAARKHQYRQPLSTEINAHAFHQSRKPIPHSRAFSPFATWTAAISAETLRLGCEGCCNTTSQVFTPFSRNYSFTCLHLPVPSSSPLEHYPCPMPFKLHIDPQEHRT